MFKTITAALAPIAVFGRGTGSGVSVENAGEVELIPGKLILYTYNEDNAGTDEFHGDLWYGTDATKTYTEFVDYGYCIRLPSSTETVSTKWDCMQVRTQVNPTKLAADSVYG